MDENIRLHHEWTLGKPKGEGLLGPATCSAVASAINEVEEWRIGCNWKSTHPSIDEALKLIMSEAAKSKEWERLAAYRDFWLHSAQGADSMGVMRRRVDKGLMMPGPECKPASAAQPNVPAEPSRNEDARKTK